MKEKIVVVDDERFVTMLIAGSLRVMDFEVVSLTDSEKALALLKEEKVRLLVTDIMMPKLDGMQLCRQIRKIKSHTDLKILALTAKKLNVDERKELMDLHVDVMSKPFSPVDLKEKITLLLA